ncbi:oxygen-independent coproporphyrinogen-3 oxidase [Peptoclostridium litorale DSM 5388]|uniref:Oxygen-independent coproporphyrinogen-III oxidase 2 n=1 Tax=Peptoclostridium litorale DSM 5388 TaxID=1121324 RepID=A0A069RGH6_PEPLI|nr:coproporphyrinogen dehydrogenase HemZ [Peptoclostridium litorale]KDR96096.1 oxygen-independent coproporphyrinogen-III oxidase 2 [Peptoclostridium litorale DSM 5388]SIO04762.1 oxygen-independent coproporphyrinogen-3 oxidase [Peptoclostridium litorale DSM 5388]
MLYISLENEKFKYETGELVKLFEGDFEFADSNDGFERFISLDISKGEDSICSRAAYYVGGVLKHEKECCSKNCKIKDSHGIKRESKNLLKKALYIILSEIHGKSMPWGILTGIRPTKIVQELLDEGLCKEDVCDVLTQKYMLSPQKASMALEIALTERKYIYPIDDSLISLYVSIPFCPTRCIYCSFPSNTLKQWGHLKAKYVECLIKEIEEIADMARLWGKKLHTVYIGGGTPTTLDANELKELIVAIRQSFDFSSVVEFTVEAGRVDTIDEEKLDVLREMEIDRISINPQTMNDLTLKKVGRNHSAKDIEDAFHLARRKGFTNINMDIILGLPGEDVDMVKYTLGKIAQLSPESLTVHTMAIKRASRLKEEIDSHELAQYENVSKMVQTAMESAIDMDLRPYYMYRQKHMLGNLENIGYAKVGCECIYNINIMEETQTILAAGAGAISKFVYHDENRIERVPNVKNIEHYIERVDEMILRKKKEVLKNAD